MASKKTSQSAAHQPAGDQQVPASMVKAADSAWHGPLSRPSRTSGLSRQRMTEARGDLMRTEREYITLAERSRDEMVRRTRAIEQAIQILKDEAWAVERETETRVAVLKAQARMEMELAEHIKNIAERSALSVLDRIREASDSLMDWAGAIGGDLKQMMQKEAEAQAERQVAEIKAIDEALEEESRAVELLELTGRYNRNQAA